MTRNEKQMLKRWYASSGYAGLQFRGGELWAKKQAGGAWGLLLTARQVTESIQDLHRRRGVGCGNNG